MKTLLLFFLHNFFLRIQSTVVVPHSVFEVTTFFFWSLFLFHSVVRVRVRLPVKYAVWVYSGVRCYECSSGRMSAVVVNQLLYWTVYRSWSNTNVYFIGLCLSLVMLLLLLFSFYELNAFRFLRTYFRCAANDNNNENVKKLQTHWHEANTTERNG